MFCDFSRTHGRRAVAIRSSLTQIPGMRLLPLPHVQRLSALSGLLCLPSPPFLAPLRADHEHTMVKVTGIPLKEFAADAGHDPG